MSKCHSALVILLLVSVLTGCSAESPVVTSAVAESPPPPAPKVEPSSGLAAPPWVGEHFEAMVGVWITDNSAYLSENEPFDQYGMEWSWGIGEKSLVGRLYGLQEGREVATFWEFREFWHVGEGHLVTQQFGGDGRFGVGPHTRTGEHSTEMVQSFFVPQGETMRVGHRSTRRDGELTTESFDIDGEGEWKPRRSYVWFRQAPTP
ncbi:MAG: hypothetical protein AAF604_23710 [Acidobacteriota bacterium]